MLNDPFLVSTQHQKKTFILRRASWFRAQIRDVVVCVYRANLNRALSFPFPWLVISQVEIHITLCDLASLDPVDASVVIHVDLGRLLDDF